MKKSPITRIELVTFRLAIQIHIHWTMVSIEKGGVNVKYLTPYSETNYRTIIE